MGILDQYKNSNPAPNNATPQPRQIPAQSGRDALSSIDGIDPGSERRRFTPGHYTAEIQRCYQTTTRKHEDLYCVQFLVSSSDSDATPSGVVVEWAQKITGVEPKQVAQNLGGFLLAVISPENEAERSIVVSNMSALLRDAAGTGQSLKNRRVSVEAFKYVRKSDGEELTLCRFLPAGK